MSLNITCLECNNTFRFKGRKSEISRGKRIPCPRCRGTVSVAKKHNGKIIVMAK